MDNAVSKRDIFKSLIIGNMPKIEIKMNKAFFCQHNLKASYFALTNNSTEKSGLLLGMHQESLASMLLHICGQGTGNYEQIIGWFE